MNTDLILQNVTRHIQLDKTESDFFISLLTHQTIKRRDFLLKQGEIARTENFITKGCLRMYTVDDSGAEHIIMIGVEDWWVDDLCSFLTKSPATYFIDALEDTEVLQITKDNLDKLFEIVPKFERFFRIIFQNFIISQFKRIDQSLSYTAEQRFLEYIRKYPHIYQRVSQKQISSYLGITPVFLSMLRRKIASR
ncbi:MAG TPA: Crp/Fnr family transcriptional regulator [Chitinophagaceae bacterium]|nr:Crp/Fnr family transcriptional regulator [Chitinophagaceae bacterium]